MSPSELFLLWQSEATEKRGKDNWDYLRLFPDTNDENRVWEFLRRFNICESSVNMLRTLLEGESNKDKDGKDWDCCQGGRLCRSGSHVEFHSNSEVLPTIDINNLDGRTSSTNPNAVDVRQELWRLITELKDERKALIAKGGNEHDSRLSAIKQTIIDHREKFLRTFYLQKLWPSGSKQLVVRPYTAPIPFGPINLMAFKNHLDIEINHLTLEQLAELSRVSNEETKMLLQKFAADKARKAVLSRRVSLWRIRRCR